MLKLVYGFLHYLNPRLSVKITKQPDRSIKIQNFSKFIPLERIVKFRLIGNYLIVHFWHHNQSFIWKSIKKWLTLIEKGLTIFVNLVSRSWGSSKIKSMQKNITGPAQLPYQKNQNLSAAGHENFVTGTVNYALTQA